MLTLLVKETPANNTNEVAPLMSTVEVYVIGEIACVGVTLGVELGDPVELWVCVWLCDDVADSVKLERCSVMVAEVSVTVAVDSAAPNNEAPESRVT